MLIRRISSLWFFCACCVEFGRVGRDEVSGGVELLEIWSRDFAVASTKLTGLRVYLPRRFCRVSTGKLISPWNYFCTGTHRTLQPLWIIYVLQNDRNGYPYTGLKKEEENYSSSSSPGHRSKLKFFGAAGFGAACCCC